MQFSRHAARALALAAQGLLQPAGTGATKDDLLATIRRMGALQIDTIHVIARSPYFVLWSRLGAYPPCWLDELLAEGAIFEGWSHAACFLPIEDYGLYRRRMLERAARSQAWFAMHADLAGTMLAHIREHGSVRAADWSRTDGRVASWWDWKPEKQALEYLLDRGDLMVARRTATFERVYDLRERVLPGWDDRNTPTREEMYRTLALKAVRALGVALPQWIPDYFRTSKRETIAHLAALAREGALLPARSKACPMWPTCTPTTAQRLRPRRTGHCTRSGPRSSRRSIRSCGTAPVPRCCGGSATASKPIRPPPRAATGTFRCRFCTAVRWSGVSIRRRIASRASSRSERCTWKRAWK